MTTGSAPFADVAFFVPSVELSDLGGGATRLVCPDPLDPYPDHMIDPLRRWANEAPDRDYLCERAADGNWRRVTYAQAWSSARGIAQKLIDRDFGADRPIAILSDNGIDHGLMMLGAMMVGIPVLPISPAYSLMSQDHAKLKGVIAHHDPAAIFVDRAEPFAAALAALDLSRVLLVTSHGDNGSESLDDWMAGEGGVAIDERIAGLGPETIAKILLTSGSTGMPKGVINTQRMMCSNQAMMAQVWPFSTNRPPVAVDWLPWNHTFGGNFNFNFILLHGGTLYIDEGRPAPGRLDATIRNLREIPSTIYYNVPRGFDMLIPVLEGDDALRDALFRDVDVLFFAGAALPLSLRQRLEALSVASRGDRVPIVTSLGATETGPAATIMNWDSDVSGNIGVPLPGSEMKLVPSGDKLEVRFKGPNVTPGYYKEPELTEKVFDDEGYFGIGDAAKFLDAADPTKGLIFDGRVAENFKLMSGTWVHAGILRLQAIDAGSPVIQDAVVTGENREEVGLLAFANPAGCRSLCPDVPDDTPISELVTRPEVHSRIADGMAQHNAANPGSSMRITRVLLMSEPPQIDASEITDKGYINQRAVLSRRASLVERLYEDDPASDVVIVPRK